MPLNETVEGNYQSFYVQYKAFDREESKNRVAKDIIIPLDIETKNVHQLLKMRMTMKKDGFTCLEIKMVMVAVMLMKQLMMRQETGEVMQM